MAATNKAGPPDFSEPWKFSDVILVVEDQRFHVHRSTLAFWSPVFEKMFSSDFKEKNNDEIPLPGKKASEIKELLQIMYPSLEEKVVAKANCYFLLDLGREYQITSITQKCEDFLVSTVKTRKEEDVLAELIVGQNYELKTLVKTCVYEARRLSLNQLKQHTKRAEIEPDNYLQIAEGIIARLELLEEKCKEVRDSSLKKARDLSQVLYFHVKPKLFASSYKNLTGGLPFSSKYLAGLKQDRSEGNCANLSEAAEHLEELEKIVSSL